MFGNEVCSFSHEGAGELVNDSKKVDKSGTLMRLTPNIGEYTRLTEPERINPESFSHNPIEYRVFAPH